MDIHEAGEQVYALCIYIGGKISRTDRSDYTVFHRKRAVDKFTIQKKFCVANNHFSLHLQKKKYR
jgi:hypothetical protein